MPAGNAGTRRPLEFRFFVVEDPTINAEALPDGTLLIHTGLLGAMENEAQLAFVLSHEISHVLQVHYWREVHETRAQRVGLIIAGIAAGAFVGDVGIFMAGLGVASVVNGHQQSLRPSCAEHTRDPSAQSVGGVLHRRHRGWDAVRPDRERGHLPGLWCSANQLRLVGHFATWNDELESSADVSGGHSLRPIGPSSHAEGSTGMAIRHRVADCPRIR